MLDRLSGPPQASLTVHTGAPLNTEQVLAELMTDRRAGNVVETDAESGTIWFTAAQAAFLRRASASRRRPVIVSGEFAELSEPMRQALRHHRGGWAVRDNHGEWRNGITGRRLDRAADSVDPARATDLNDYATAYLRPANSDCAQLMVSATARHRLEDAPLPGELIELLMATLHAVDGVAGTDVLASAGHGTDSTDSTNFAASTGSGRRGVSSGGLDVTPWSFGQTEPARRPWNATELSRLSQQDQAAGKDLSSFMIAGSRSVPASVTLTIRWRGRFVDEHVNGLISLGQMGDPELSRKLAAVDQVMEALATAAGITFALVMARAGNRALTQPPLLPSAPVPLSILLGDSLVKGLGIDPGRASRRFQAAPALGGQGLVVPLDAAASGRPHLAELFDALNFYRANPRMGISPQQLQTLHYVAQR